MNLLESLIVQLPELNVIWGMRLDNYEVKRENFFEFLT